MDIAVAVGTLGTVVVALFGAKLLPKPCLKLRLLRQEGEKTQLTRENFGVVEIVDEVRYYHIRVSNERRWIRADDVQVYLVRLEEPGPDGDLQVQWLGNEPIRWRDQEMFPLRRVIGADADCDLCRVGKNTGLSLMLLLPPNNLKAHRRDSCRLVLSLQARSNQADSEVTRIEISWDGSWEDGAVEMQRHLLVKQHAPERSR